MDVAEYLLALLHLMMMSSLSYEREYTVGDLVVLKIDPDASVAHLEDRQVQKRIIRDGQWTQSYLAFICQASPSLFPSRYGADGKEDIKRYGNPLMLTNRGNPGRF